MSYRQTVSISGLIWRNITVRTSEDTLSRRQNKARTVEGEALERPSNPYFLRSVYIIMVVSN
jgi:hypothetical protein